MTNRYQLAGVAAYHLGVPFWLCPFDGSKGHAWKVGWSLAWAGEREAVGRIRAENSVRGHNTEKD